MLEDRVPKPARSFAGEQAAMAAFDSATFSGAARFEDANKVTGTASSLTYLADQGTLNLSGSEPASLRPHVVNDQISVDANSIDVVLKRGRRDDAPEIDGGRNEDDSQVGAPIAIRCGAS